MKNEKMEQDTTDRSGSESNKPAYTSITQALPTAQPMSPQHLTQTFGAHGKHTMCTLQKLLSEPAHPHL